MGYYDDDLTLYQLIRDLFVAASITCFLYAMHRIARGTIMAGQVAAFAELSDAYTPEEREALIHRIKVESFKY